MLRLFTDTDNDLTPEVAASYGYEPMISMPYIINDEIIYPYKDSNTFEFKPFYDKLRAGIIPTTCALSVEDYKNYFEPIFAAGDDILYVHFSAAMTATFDFMNKALEELKEKYPERKFYEIDTMAITIGSYCTVIEIAKRIKAGMEVEKVIEWAKEERQHFACYFFADDLKFFKHSGRVSGLAAFMGGIIGIKPIISISEKGVMDSVGKVKGRKKALEQLINYVEELSDDIYSYKCVIGHTDAPELAEMLKEMLLAKFNEKPLDLDVVYANPTIGAHCGPDSVGLCFHAKHR